MLISVMQRTKFKAGDKEFITPTDNKGFALLGIPFEAPDWIVHDPYFTLLSKHNEYPVGLGDHPSLEYAHPSGTEPLLKVYGQAPSIPVSRLDNGTLIGPEESKALADEADAATKKQAEDDKASKAKAKTDAEVAKATA